MVNETVSHYRIVEKLGGGGMGVVYRAEDLKLGRQVALKFLPDDMAGDPVSLERFEREARAAAAINHPNICTIYEVGDHDSHPFLVMELLEGATLREKIGGRPVPLDTLLTWAIQIADGLDAAHSRGIVHRDIKPANLFLVNHGQVKILDFGLARPVASRRPAAQPADRTATIAVDVLTQPGSTAGTPGYMSPEQAKGDEIDARTDLFSLGVVLYEMATGKLPFEGKTSAVVMAAILHQAPDPPGHVNIALPGALDHIILKALEKDPDVRYQSAAEMRADLKRLKRDTDSNRSTAVISGLHPAPAPTSAHKRSWTPVLIALIAALALVAGIYFATRSPAPPRVLRTVAITNDRRARSDLPVVTDGSRLYFSSQSIDGVNEPWQVAAKPGPSVPVPTPLKNSLVLDVSPDRSELLVLHPMGPQSPATLWALPLLGGSPRRLGNLNSTGGGAWSPDGQRIVYTIDDEVRLAKNDGGDLGLLVKVKGRPYLPHWSPDGRTIRFTLGLPSDSDTIWEVAADGGNLHQLFPVLHDPNCCGVWTPDGKYFVFSVFNGDTMNVWAARERTGLLRRSNLPPVQLTSGPLNLEYPVVSADGKRIFVTGSQMRHELVILNSASKRFQSYLGGITAQDVSSSRDGNQAAYVSLPDNTLWRTGIGGESPVQLTFPPLHVQLPRWSPDAKQIAFAAQNGAQPRRIYVIPADGGDPQQITNGEAGPMGDGDPNWSPDGKSIVFGDAPDDRRTAKDPSLMVLRVIDLNTRQVSVLPGSEGLWSPRWSPDGRYIAGLSAVGWKLRLYNLATHQQTELSSLEAGYPSWSHDGQWVHFVAVSGRRIWYRVRVADRKLEEVYSENGEQRLVRDSNSWTGLAADDCILALRDTGTREIFALDWDAP